MHKTVNLLTLSKQIPPNLGFSTDSTVCYNFAIFIHSHFRLIRRTQTVTSFITTAAHIWHCGIILVLLYRSMCKYTAVHWSSYISGLSSILHQNHFSQCSIFCPYSGLFQAQSDEDDLHGDEVAVSVELSRMDEFFQATCINIRLQKHIIVFTNYLFKADSVGFDKQ